MTDPPSGLGQPPAFARIRNFLPEGRGLPAAEWQQRHRVIRLFLLGHALALPVVGLVRDWSPAYALGEGAILALLALLAGYRGFSRSLRSGVAAMGCVIASAVLVQFSGGLIEAHFHFFVVVALISLYQDWVPFSLAVLFVALDHGVTGVLLPDWVYNHAAARQSPWTWAGIHAGFVLAECVALVAVWRANEQARAATDRVLRSTGEGLLGVDADCLVVFANPAALAISGRDERALLGQPLYGLVRGEDGRPAFPPDVLRQNPGAFSSQAWLARPDGRNVPVEILCTPFEGSAHSEGAVVALRDLTDRLRAEDERRAAMIERQELQQLREVNSFKTRFMNMAAHELSTPLTPIKLQMHMLKSNLSTPPLDRHKRSVELLDRNFARLSGLVGDLLDSSRLQSDRMPLRPQPFDLAGVVRDTVEAFQPAAQESKTSLAATIPGSIPATGDPERITQVVVNFLSNALKFTPPGGQVQIQVVQEPGKAKVLVRDTGIGLTPEQAARLFQPFEQVHESQVHTKGGSGLGLYIARGIIELHGGKVAVESPGPGKGSTFSFEIPTGAAGSGAAA